MKKVIFMSFIITMVIMACNDVLETQPKQSIDTNSAIGNATVLAAIVSDNYDILQDNDMYGSDLVMLPDVMGDNLESTAERSTFEDQYLFVNGSHMGFWNEAWEIITQANLVLFGAEPLTDQDEKDRIQGEAFAQRAFAYFSLMNAYAYMPTAIPGVNGLPSLDPSQNRGGVPIITDAQLTIADVEFPERATIDAVYTQIRSDLDNAINLLSPGGVTTFNQDNVRALASRVALYQGDYENVILLAQAASPLDGTDLSSRADYANDWLDPIHPEGLFVLVFDETEAQFQNGPHNLYGSDFTVNSSIFNGDGDHPVSVFLNNYFDVTAPADIRGTVVRDVVSPGKKNPVGTPELIKYAGRGGVDMSDPIPIVRSAEMYLNVAEAAVRQAVADENLARTTLNVLRTARFGPGFDIPATTTGQALIDAIMFERRIELLGEGHRFFDLKRNGLDVDKRAQVGATVFFNTSSPDRIIGFEEPEILAPIPTSEIDVNQNLDQNFGY